MMTKETLWAGLIGTVIGLICSKVIVYLLAANGAEDTWMVGHRFYGAFIISLVFGLAAVIFYSIKKWK